MTIGSPDDPIQVDLDKGSSKDFEIRTMADDLANPLQASAPSGGVPPTPSVTPESLLPPANPAPAQKKTVTAPKEVPSDLIFENEPAPIGGWLKSFLVGFTIVLLLGVIGIGGWWWYGNRLATTITPPTSITPTTPPTITPPVSAQALLPVDKKITLPIETSDTQAAFFSKLSSLISSSATSLTKDALVEIDVTKDGKHMSIDELGNLAGIDFSGYSVGGDYIVVLAMPQDAPVLGLVVSLASANTTKDTLLAKEQDMPALASEIYTAYAKNSLPQAASNTFLDNVYQGVAIRYLNFSLPTRAIDYAVYDKLLLIGGSREMAYTLIDRAKLAPLSVAPTSSAAPTNQ